MMKNLFIFNIIFILAFCVTGQPASDAMERAAGSTIAAPAMDASRPHHGAAGPNGGWSPAFSPDGSRVAFLSSTLHTPADLWVMNADGTGVRRLTTRGVQAFTWAEDGATIRFSTVRKGFEEVYTISVAEDGDEKRMPGLPPGASLPVYSPDGSLFAVTVPDEKRTRDLWIGTADGERLEAVTEILGVRSFFWHPDSRRIYFEAGQTYGVGIWEIDLATMESKSLLGKYIGTPVYSSQSDLVAYPYPINPGEFELHTMQLDGSGIESHPTPRLVGRGFVWDAEGKGVYYLGQDIEKIVAPPAPLAPAAKSHIARMLARIRGLFSGDSQDQGGKTNTDEQQVIAEVEGAPPQHIKTKNTFRRVGVTSLWHLDLAGGNERRVSPPELHLTDFSLAPDGRKMVLAGVSENSYATELFSLDPGTAELSRLTQSRASAWLPVPSLDSSKIAYFTNEAGVDSLKIVNLQGQEVAIYPGIIQELGTRLFWLPESEGLLVFSGREMVAFTDQGIINFPNRKDHRTLLAADVSIQADKVLLNSIPRHGETPGLYLLEAVDKKFVQTDLRFPTGDEYAADLYMQPRWSLDGSKIAFTDLIDIWTMRGDGTGRIWLTNYAERNSAGEEKPALASYPVWSVRGEMIAFTLTIFEEKGLLRQLWVMKADGSEPKMLYSQPVDSQFQVYLPEYTHLPFFDFDDKRIIFTAQDNGLPNIYAAGINDGTLHRLTEAGAIFPAMIPEEGVIVYTSLAGDTEELMVMSSDGSGKRPLLGKAAATADMAGMEKK
jgi:Tol biopolymer transport system component